MQKISYAGRPSLVPGEVTKAFLVRLPESLYQEAKDAATAGGVPLSELIRAAITAELSFRRALAGKAR